MGQVGRRASGAGGGMSDIGHNGAPAFDAMEMHIADLFALVADTTAGATVTTDEQEAALDDLLDQMRQARKDADAERIAEKRPHDDAAKAVQVKWLPLLRRCEIGADEIKRLLTPYREQKQREKDEAARQARAEADAHQKAAEDALRSGDMGQKLAGEADLAAAKKLAVVANKLDRAPTGLRTAYRAEVTDMTAFARWAWANRRAEVEAFFTDLATQEARRGPVEIPGLIIHTVRKAA